MYTNILFDLDGTLTNSAFGITESVRLALLHEGFDAPSHADLVWVVGPPLRDSFAQLAKTTDTAVINRLLTKYRERFEPIGMFENEVYAGVQTVLETLRDDGYRLFLATSKPRVYAEKILRHFELEEYFDGIGGAELDGSIDSKADVIRTVLRTYDLSPESCLMIGDREHDVIGARENNINTLGVTYGFGSETELREAGAICIVRTPVEILQFIRDQKAETGSLSPSGR
ncbi:HAD family hydrolase [Alicyclobacillus dauci]|uniref:HAD family hydrolase n=1 Tax=Alicyclobacillus dauci TaxID=1475485 RepID=A0ABY6Z1L6_9BACL|nr:HAD family hydrolase [Alicyclobacillus dauci]WAH35870.1 HAD family hydrolase [Alicyclobacillus dauci]